MEGRLRVSVVATGIEAEAMAQMPPNVQPLRPAMRPTPLPVGAALKPVANAVRLQRETIAEEMRVQAPEPAPPISPVEPMILGTEDSPVIEEDDIPPMPSIVRQGPQREAPPEPKRRRLFGSWSERKPEVRAEPMAPAMRQPTIAPRATAQVLTRAATEESQRPLPRQSGSPDDLFPDHKKDDQFDIPAFLRRQSN
jgi:cell division protein FtsZ